MRINNSNLTPIKQEINTIAGTNEIKTNSISFDNLLKRYHTKVFKQAFPTAHSQFLKDVYYIELENDSLISEIRRMYSGGISDIEKLCTPSYVYTPNDFGKIVMNQL